IGTKQSVYSCPVDTGDSQWGPYYKRIELGASSYYFNDPRWAGNPEIIGLVGVVATQVTQPSRTVLNADGAIWMPFSWHDGNKKPVARNDAKNNICFVDGHVQYLPVHSNGFGAAAPSAEPPAAYSYKWNPYP